MSDLSPTYERRGHVTCVLFCGEFENLDEQLLDAIRDDLLEKAYAADPPRVVVDLTNVKFFGSSFIEILFRIWNKINGLEDGRFGIAGLSKYCTEVLQVTQLDKLWKLYPNLDEALESMNS
jgi:anti-sigma B factor antagonist